MSVFVDVLHLVVVGEKSHFADQDLGLEQDRVTVDSFWIGIAGVSDQGYEDFASDFDTFSAEVANFLAPQFRELGEQFSSAVVNDVTEAGNPVGHLASFDDDFAGELVAISRFKSDQLTGKLAAIERGETVQHAADGGFGVGGKNNSRRDHLHQPTPGDVGGNCRDMVEMAMGDQPVWGPHEVPRMGPEVETETKFVNPPISLHCGPRVTFDGQATELETFDWNVLQHGRSNSTREKSRV